MGKWESEVGSCSVAFKEWASMLVAMESGDQALLLRKGGLSEDAGVFRMEHSRFLLFPTFEHQDTRLLQPQWAPLIAATLADQQTRIPIRTFAQVARVLAIPDSGAASQLKKHIIWNQCYIDSRFEWQPDRPVYLVVLRVYQLANPISIDYRSEYGGCRSWVTLDVDVPIQGANPVIDDERFSHLLHDIDQWASVTGAMPAAIASHEGAGVGAVSPESDSEL
jgi:hypothetical protein